MEATPVLERKEISLCPQYQSKDQKRLQAMEGKITNISAFLKGMQDKLDHQHDSLKHSLDSTTAAISDLSSWKPQVQAEVQELQIGMCDLLPILSNSWQSLPPKRQPWHTRSSIRKSSILPLEHLRSKLLPDLVLLKCR